MKTALHRNFSHHPLDAVNFGKEFFYVDLNKIRGGVEEMRAGKRLIPGLRFLQPIVMRARDWVNGRWLDGRRSRYDWYVDRGSKAGCFRPKAAVWEKAFWGLFEHQWRGGFWLLGKNDESCLQEAAGYLGWISGGNR